MRRLEEDDLGSERVLIGPSPADGQRHTGPTVVGLGQVGTPPSGADRRAECNITLEEGQLPQLTVPVKLDSSKGRLGLTLSARRQK